MLVTHAHADHCCEEDIAAASHEGTVAAGPESVAARLASVLGEERVTVLEVGRRFTRDGLEVTALPMRGPEQHGAPCGFHPPGGGLAYRIEVAGFTYLAMGDSTALAEHEGFAPDVAFVPVGGLVVMDEDEAVEAAVRIGPRLAVPVHWGDLNARHDTAQRFIDGCTARGIRAALGPSG